MKFFVSRTARDLPVALLASMAMISCSRAPLQESRLADSATFDPKPVVGQEETIENMLKRYEGQTKFANVYENFNMRHRLNAAPESAAATGAQGTERRTVQDSDIFKVGKPNSKLLFLLNNYRGLQVVSFAKGADKPELLGRVPATGNFPDTMFYDDKNDRLIVVEREYVDEIGESAWGKEQSALVIYDVKEPSAPNIVARIPFKGNAADTRLVGDVLYVAASYSTSNAFSPNLGRSMKNGQPVGVVYSFSLATDEIKTIAEHTLSLPSYRENMNIVEVAQQDGSYRYYLIAALSHSQWGWWNAGTSVVEVVDITSPKGVIEPLMTANVRGTILERSATQIKNNTLIAVSNYMAADSNRTRIAVETFVLPNKNSEVLSADEVSYRKSYIERVLRKLVATGASEEQIEAKRKELNTDTELGLAGRFEKSNSSLNKIYADSVVTVGDSRGENASLQDVRFHNDLLYAFWVPSSQVDPLDVFDISKPEEGVSYLGRLEFEGWIERSFPISLNGKNYILGLGLINPAENNERNIRYPQARLFEIRKRANGTLVKIDLDSITLSDRNAWVDLNNQDKFVEMRMSDASTGKGSLLFQMYKWDTHKYTSGGKILNFDLSKAEDGGVFAEGGMVSSDWGWLRRVFTNPEIERINTFTDEELGVFDTTSGGHANDVFEAVGRLELARNIKAYLTIANAGVQIVEKGQDYYYWAEGETKVHTELRYVDAADAERSNAQILKLRGSYQDHLVKDNQLFVITRISKRERIEGSADLQVKSSFVLQRFEAKNESLELTGTLEQEMSERGIFGRGFAMPWFIRDAALKLVLGVNGDIYVQEEAKLYLVNNISSLSLTPVTTQGCDIPNAKLQSFITVDKQAFFSWALLYNSNGPVVTPDDELVRDQNIKYYRRNFIAKLDPIGGDISKLACGTATNIPGSLVGYNDLGLMVEDQRYIDTVTIERQYPNSNGTIETSTYEQQVTKNVLASLTAKDSVARLVDMYDHQADGDSESRWSSAFSTYKRLGNDFFVFVEPKNVTEYDNTVSISTLGFDDHRHFTKSTRVVQTDLIGQLNLSAILQGAQKNYLVLNSGSRIQLYILSGVGSKPVSVKLKLDGTDTFQNSLRLPATYFFDRYNEVTRIDFVEASKSINFPQGLYGVVSAKFE